MYNDSLSNLIAGMGDPIRDKFAGATYTHTGLTDEALRCAYQSSWMIRKAVDIPAMDATRRWRDWDADEDAVDRLKKEETRLGLRAKVRQAKIMARLWGGAVIAIGTRDKDMSEPLDPSRVNAGGLRYLAVLPRREIAAKELDRNLGSEYFSRPRAYDYMGAENIGFVEVHPSRLVVMLGAEQADPWLSAGVNYGWGDSIIDPIYDAMKAAGSTMHNIASLIFEANVDVIKTPDLMVRASDPAFERNFLKRTALAAAAKGINKTLLLDKDEDYDRKSASFSSLDSILAQFLLICSGAAGIPATRFLGQSPAGLSPSGKEEMRNYYDMVSGIQEDEIGPCMAVLDACIARSALGDAGAGLTYKWNALEQPNEAEQATTAKTTADTAKTLVEAGVFEAGEMRQAITPVLTERGGMASLTRVVQESDEAADPEFDLGEDGDDAEAT